ncbi:hypothetical protein GGS23DRAFT_280358 [Durotheca rogersii]|uniref:uncharacterized protein n=1 Tax=Durotheca rogersii TaxID=419775 RepID=UPI002220465F|nr:uncharacterized protein GGS23DRAFT_280358 [Durotheca rogersii]KAI5866634.1 hypothetical protein GGS23DRAFT_280358 [Durotheca rogersii]
MPPHLHPRSRMTSSLFATTVAASFFVVALPHILPCPAPRVAYADSDGARRRRPRRAPQPGREEDGDDDAIAIATTAAAPGARKTPGARECPVPKPGGFVGELMGFGPAKTQTRRETLDDDHNVEDGR